MSSCIIYFRARVKIINFSLDHCSRLFFTTPPYQVFSSYPEDLPQFTIAIVFLFSPLISVQTTKHRCNQSAHALYTANRYLVSLCRHLDQHHWNLWKASGWLGGLVWVGEGRRRLKSSIPDWRCMETHPGLERSVCCACLEMREQGSCQSLCTDGALCLPLWLTSCAGLFLRDLRLMQQRYIYLPSPPPKYIKKTYPLLLSSGNSNE